MNSDVDVLPAVSRLVIAYAPGKVREWHETLLLLDARLAGIVRSASEPMLAQLRLAWWRERFAQSVTDWPQGEPLLARLANWGRGPERSAGSSTAGKRWSGMSSWMRI